MQCVNILQLESEWIKTELRQLRMFSAPGIVFQTRVHHTNKDVHYQDEVKISITVHASQYTQMHFCQVGNQ